MEKTKLDRLIMTSCINALKNVIESFTLIKHPNDEENSTDYAIFMMDLLSNLTGNVLAYLSNPDEKESLKENLEKMKNGLDVWYEGTMKNRQKGKH